MTTRQFKALAALLGFAGLALAAVAIWKWTPQPVAVEPPAPVPVAASAEPAQPRPALPDTLALERYFKNLTPANSVEVTVQAGDNLTKIAKQHRTTAGTVQAANFLKNDRIRVGQKLKVPTLPWPVLVDKSENLLFLRAGEQIIRSYPVATGKDADNVTPVGAFKITDRLTNPTWHYEGKVVPPGDPENPLGTRWLGLDREGYGIHGTAKPDEIGKYATLGCVRMLNSDIEPLFELLPSGASVTIVD